MKKSRYVPIILAGLLVSACLGAFAYTATGSSSTNVIYACANRTNGQMRLATRPQDCKNQEVALAWNQVGPEGPPGPPGSSAESFQIFTETVTFSDPGQWTGSASCGDGYLRVSLLAPDNLSEGVTITGAEPSLHDDVTGTWHFETEGPAQVTLRILCVQLGE